MAEKPHMNLAMIGHVDHGKSTLVGRLLFETGNVGAHIIDAYKKEAEAKGKGSFEFAWVMDSLKEERERGVTIDVAHQRFDTENYYFTIVDCPGHRDFVKNMITGHLKRMLQSSLWQLLMASWRKQRNTYSFQKRLG